MEKLAHEKQVVLLDMPSLILSIEIYNPISLGDLYGIKLPVIISRYGILPVYTFHRGHFI